MFWHNAWSKWGKFSLFALIVLGGGVIRLHYAWSDTFDLVTRILPDDSYYYFTIAERIAQSGLSSFDGIHLTNGYHPLWMGIAAIIYRYFPSAGNPDFPIHLLLTIGAVFDVCTGLLLLRWLRKMQVSFGGRFLIAILYFFNPWIIAHGINGLESALANLLLLVTTVCAAKCLRVHERLRFKWLSLFSCLAALTILARIDYVIFIACLGLFLLFKSYRQWKAIDYVSVFLSGAVILGAWIGWSWHTFGAIIPQSGFAFTMVNKTLFYYKERAWWQPCVWSVYQWGQTLRLAARVSGFSWLLWISLLGFGGWVIRAKTKKQPLSLEVQLISVLVVGFVIYTIVQGAIRWSGREWYFSFGPILALLALSPWLLRVRFTIARGALVTLVCLGLFWSQNPFRAMRFESQREMYEAAKQLPTLVPKETQMGAYNAGIYGYYSGRSVVNLDGLVNISAFHALRDRTMYQYLKQEKIDFILDYDIAVQYRYKPFWGREDLEFLEVRRVLEERSAYHGSKLILFAVR